MNKRLLALIGTLGFLIAGCSDTTDEFVVATSSYPMTFVAESILGDSGAVLDLSSSGGDAHDLELSPRQVSELESASFVLYLGSGFQPAVEHAVHQRSGPGLDALDTVPEEQLRDGDPHMWLNPELMAAVGEELADELRLIDPDKAATFEENAARLTEEMDALDNEYREGLKGCTGETMLASHEAFGYLADAYGLQQIGVLGVNPEAEPSPKRLQEVAAISGVRTLFIESNDSSGSKLSASLGLDPVPLNTLEVAPKEGDYFSVMRDNLRSLRSGLDCAN